MVSALAVLVTVVAAAEVWTESSLVRVFPDTAPASGATRRVRLYVARNECESFQVCLRAGKRRVEVVDVQAKALGEGIGPPACRWVGYLRVDEDPAGGRVEGRLWPDPLLDFEPFALEPGATCSLWVTYGVGADAAPGTHLGRITLREKGGRKHVIRISLTVFDFVLPSTPSLRTAFGLDRRAVQRVYGLDDADLDAWKPVYDAFSLARISYGLWDGGGLVAFGGDGSVDTSALKAHLAYAVDSAHMNGIDLGAGGLGIAPFPSQDAARAYLRDMGDWLEGRAWLRRAYVCGAPLVERSGWPEVRGALERIKKADWRIGRFLQGDLAPGFEAHTEIWAVPLRRYDPHAGRLLRAGLSLAAKPSPAAQSVTASSSRALPGNDGHATRAEDACDGSVFTFWLSGATPADEQPQWLDIAFGAPVTTDTVNLVWRTGYEAVDVSVRTALLDSPPSAAEVSWELFPPEGTAHSWARGTLGSPQTFTTLRLEFSRTYLGGPVGVTELFFDRGPMALPSERATPTEPWLYALAGDFPSFEVDAHRVDARLFPWLCYAGGACGFVHAGLNHWPEAWARLADAAPLVWSGGKRGRAFLYYPGRGKPMPSIRSELLRDGMEDYEYLVAYERWTETASGTFGEVVKPGVLGLLDYRNPPRQDLDAIAEGVETDRVHMGRALSGAAPKGSS